MSIQSALVIGTGMMGPGIAGALALGGVRATIVSRSSAGARRGLESALLGLRVLNENGLIDQAHEAAAADKLASTHQLEEMLPAVDLVVESAPEDMAFKQDLFARLESLAHPDAILASNTSGLSITAIALKCTRPHRVITTHFWNPPHLMPLVEIVRGEKTSDETVAVMRDLLKQCGKVPVLVKKDRPGQLGNRMQMAMVREAVNIVQEGIADPEDVDTAARIGFGLRLPAYGVLEHQDMVGLVLGHAVCDYIARDLYNEPKAPDLYREKIARGETGVAAGRGFHDWSRKSAAEVRERRDKFVIECLRRGITHGLA